MSILIIEDDDLKLERLQRFISDQNVSLACEVARSYKSGLRALVDQRYLLVLMDMTLPTFDIQSGSDGGRPLSLGGRDLLRQMKRRKVTSPTAVVTGFDIFGSGPGIVTLKQLDLELANEFSEFYLGSVYFNATTEDWRDQLRQLIRPSINVDSAL